MYNGYVFLNRLANCFFCKDVAGKLDLLLIRVMSVFETSLSCLLYMLCLFPERACLVCRILLTLQKCNSAKSQYSFTEKRCVVKAVSLFPVHFSGGDGGLFYNLYKYNILIITYSFF